MIFIIKPIVITRLKFMGNQHAKGFANSCPQFKLAQQYGSLQENDAHTLTIEK